MSTKRSLFLSVRVRVQGMKPRIRLRLPVAIFSLHHLLLSWDALLCLLPGQPGQIARAGTEAAHGVVLGLMSERPAHFVHVDVEEEGQRVQVDVKTWGIGGGDKG